MPKRDGKPNVILHKPQIEEQLDKDQGSAESEKSELDLIIDIREGKEGATNEEE